jgi:hypothetical protein
MTWAHDVGFVHKSRYKQESAFESSILQTYHKVIKYDCIRTAVSQR